MTVSPLNLTTKNIKKSKRYWLIIPLIALSVIVVYSSTKLIKYNQILTHANTFTYNSPLLKTNFQLAKNKESTSQILNSISRSDDFYLRSPIPNRTAASVIINSVMDHQNAQMERFYCPDNIVVGYTGEVGEARFGASFIANFGCGSIYEVRNFHHSSFVINGSVSGSPTYLAYDGHQGFDFKSTDQTNTSSNPLKMLAAAGGTLTCQSDSVKTAVIIHGNGFRTRYLHMTDRICDNGPKQVSAGDPIGRIFNSGTGGIHAHFEVQVLVNEQWKTVDPYGWQGQYPDPRGNGTSTNLWKPVASTAALPTRWHPNGTLITDITDPNHTVYLIQGYEKWGIPSEKIFYDYGFDFANVIKISHQEFIRIPLGGNLDPPPSPRLRNDNGTVYEIVSRRNKLYKRGFPSLASFYGQGFRWSDVVNQSVSGIPDDPQMRVYSSPFRDGSLVAELDETVTPSVRRAKPNTPIYVISNSLKRPIDSEPAFKNLGYRFDDVLLIKKGVLDNIGTGPTICESTTLNSTACRGITNDTYPPSVLIDRWLGISSFAESKTSLTSLSDTIVLSGTGSDAESGDSGIESVTINGIRAANDTVNGADIANWTKSVQLNPGVNTFVVKVTDNSPNRNHSQQVITIDYQPPQNDTFSPLVAVSSPLGDTTIDTQQITVTGTATDSGVGDNGISSVTVNGVQASGATTQGNGIANWSATIDLNLGNNIVTVVGKDNSSNKNSTSLTFNINVTSPGQTTIPLDYSWSSKQPMPSSLEGSAVVTLNGKIHVLGGRGTDNNSPNRHYRYDPVSDHWEILADIPVLGIVDGSAVVLNGKIYAFRSFQVPFGQTDSALKIYDPGSNTWTTGASLPLGNIFGTSLVVSENRLFAIGGTNQFLTGFSAVNEYDQQSNTWILRASMTRPRGYSAVQSARGLIYVIGGIGYSSNDPGTNFVDIYDPSADSWTTASPAPYHSWQAASTLISTQASPPFRSYRIIIMAGKDNNHSRMPFVFEYNPDSFSWRQLSSLPSLLSGAVGSVANNNLYLIGGHNGSNAVNTTFQGLPKQWAPTLTISASDNSLKTNSAGSLFVQLGTAANSVTTVSLSSSNPFILPLPSTVTFNPGETLKTVSIQSSEINTGNVELTAQLPVSSGNGIATVSINVIAKEPTIATNQATEVSSISALLNGNVNSNSAETKAWFEWTTDPSFNSYSSTALQIIGAGNVPKHVSHRLDNLLPNTNYYFRIVASNNGGTTRQSTVSWSFTTLSSVVSTNRALFDFDGDKKSDVSVFRPESGTWHLLQSQTGYAANGFGISTDKLVPADYDGDGKTDLAVFRENPSDPGKAKFYILQSANNQVKEEQFGSTGDVPVAGDWDGDGKFDIGVYRQGTLINPQGYFYYRPSSQPTVSFIAFPWGSPNDKPVVADFDGDGKTDASVFRPSTGVWYIQRSRDGFYAIQFGSAEDKPVAGDYDGDGKTDQAVFRPSNGVWYIWNSTSGFSAAQFGISTDKPVPADYDGDGKTDMAVYRNGTWFVLNSTDGFAALGFGNITDNPVAHSFIR